MDDIKTIVKKIDEIYKTEYHENLDTEKMLIENALTDYLSSQFEQLVKPKIADTGCKTESSVNVEAEVIKPVAVNYEQPRFKDAEEHGNFLSNTTRIIKDLIANGIMPYKGFKIYDGDDILYIDAVLYDARTTCLAFESTC